jgi:C1A family cysteine protease
MEQIQGRIAKTISIIILGLTAVAISACNDSGGQQANPVAPESVAIMNPGTGNPGPTPAPPSSDGKTPSLAGQLGINTSVDLRQYDGPVMSQFGGTCSTFGTASAMNNALKQHGINKLISERHLWETYGVYDMDAAVASASKNYLTEEQYWPVNDVSAPSGYLDHASLKITQTVEHQYDLNGALQGLSKGHPLVMAIQVPDDLGNCNAMISPTSTAGSGQHVIAAVGYILDDAISGGGYFIVKNSWGTGCGDKGYHYFPFSLCKRSDLYCYFTEITGVEDRAAL